MKKPTKRVGCRDTAAATDASSPGTLAIRADRATPLASSSCAQRSASTSGDPGSSHCSSRQSDSTVSLRPRWRESVEKNWLEKKWQWLSLSIVHFVVRCVHHQELRPFPPHEGQHQSCHDEADGETDPQASHTPSERETESVSDR